MRFVPVRSYIQMDKEGLSNSSVVESRSRNVMKERMKLSLLQVHNINFK
jgi:hypothetical protein